MFGTDACRLRLGGSPTRIVFPAICDHYNWPRQVWDCLPAHVNIIARSARLEITKYTGGCALLVIAFEYIINNIVKQINSNTYSRFEVILYLPCNRNCQAVSECL